MIVKYIYCTNDNWITTVTYLLHQFLKCEVLKKYSWCSKITLAFYFIFLLFFFYILYNQSLLHVHMEFGLIIAFIFTIIFPLLDLEISHNIVQLLFPATYFGCASHWHLFLWLPIPGLVTLIWMISTVYIWSSLRQQIAGVILIMLD